jgi:hypothetical protein
MAKFRRRPVEVDAVQFSKKRAPQRTSGMDWNTGVSYVNGTPVILTRDGMAPVCDGDWIATYADGNVEVWRPSTFAAMWEEVK